MIDVAVAGDGQVEGMECRGVLGLIVTLFYDSKGISELVFVTCMALCVTTGPLYA